MENSDNFPSKRHHAVVNISKRTFTGNRKNDFSREQTPISNRKMTITYFSICCATTRKVVFHDKITCFEIYQIQNGTGLQKKMLLIVTPLQNTREKKSLKAQENQKHQFKYTKKVKANLKRKTIKEMYTYINQVT